MKQISLKHLMINERKQIGIKFYPDKVIQALIKGLVGVKWSRQYSMAYITNTQSNIDLVFKTFRGVVWINTSCFFVNRPIHKGDQLVSVEGIRNRVLADSFRRCPEVFVEIRVKEIFLTS